MRNNNQQQKRMRGRNNNRRSQNPLTRVYESNGPDVKVRGTAHHIAEKYQQLARDAQASGDYVSAENYLQHAEHYYRIIAAAQAQFGVQGQSFQRQDDDDEDFDGEENAQGFEGGQPFQRDQQGGQREGSQRDFQPREGGQREFQPRDNYRDGNNQHRRDNRDRDRDRDRGPREGREGGDNQPREFRNERENRWQSRGERGPREYRDQQPREAPREAAEAPYRDPGGQPQPDLGPGVEAEIGLPAFITQGGAPAAAAPAQPSLNLAPPAAAEPAVEPVAVETATEEAAPAPRPRRRRYRRSETAGDAESGAGSAAPAEAGE